MREIAIISEGILPVPNIMGGAIETWITDLINFNEKENLFKLDVFCLYHPKQREYNYLNTNLISIRKYKFEHFLFRGINWILRHIRKKEITWFYNIKLAHSAKWGKYEYIIVENGMSVYIELLKRKDVQGKLIYHMRNDLEYIKDVPWAERNDVRAKIIGKTAVQILTVSDYINKRFRAVYNTEKVRTFYNCVDVDKFSIENANQKEHYWAEYGIREDDFVFLYSGRLVREKGVLELAQAFSRIASKYKNVKLIIVGSNYNVEEEFESEYRKILQQCEKQVIYGGFIKPDLMPNIYAVANMVVAPSMWEEPFGMIVVEAFAAEKPIIVTDSGGMPELVNKDRGLIISRNENVVDKLYHAMEWAILHPEECKKMGINGREFVVNNSDFRKDYLCRRLESLFGELDDKKNRD